MPLAQVHVLRRIFGVEDHHRPDFVGGRHDRFRHNASLKVPWDDVKNDRQGILDQRGRLDRRPAFFKRQVLRPATDVDAHIDVLAAVDPVPGGPNDFRHVRPHGIESRSGKRPSVARPRHGNSAGLRLIPGGENRRRRVVVIAEPSVFGVHYACQDPFRAILHTVQTPLALKNVLEVAQLVMQAIGLVPVEPVDAPLLDAVVAARTIFTPIDNTKLADRPHAWRSRLRRYVVLHRHG